MSLKDFTIQLDLNKHMVKNIYKTLPVQETVFTGLERGQGLGVKQSWAAPPGLAWTQPGGRCTGRCFFIWTSFSTCWMVPVIWSSLVLNSFLSNPCKGVNWTLRYYHKPRRTGIGVWILGLALLLSLTVIEGSFFHVPSPQFPHL